MHFELATYFVSKLPPGLVIFQNYHFCSFFFSSCTHHPLLLPSPVKLVGTLPASSPAATHTSLRLAISPSLSFLSLFLSLSFSFDITKREKEGREMEKGGGFQPVRPVSDDR